MDVNLDQALDFAKKISREAGQLLTEYWHRGVVAEYKGAIDLVSEADRASEKLILDRIRSVYPDHAILSEESGSNQTSSPYTWIVDPLDGTTNFTHGHPDFAVTIALQVKDAIELGVVIDPLRNELFAARKGQGSWLNDRRIKVSATEQLDRSLLVTGFPYDRRTNPHNNLREDSAFLMMAQGVLRSGSAAIDLASVACGRVDGYWEFRLSPWDVAAGILLVNEAGGRVTNVEGEQLAVPHTDVVASNGLIHAEMMSVLRMM
ncbi:MAG TPA: inositol monophosphatase family protein [Anaerolineae bacterium]|nr:inositol monophosphatase family protein [Anaerolineae bacterium]